MEDTDKGNEIQISGEDEKSPGCLQLPANFITAGEMENDDVRVYIKQDIYSQIEKFSSSDREKELGGILIGDHACEAGKNHIIISGYIEAKYTDSTSSTLTFTHETWEYIHSEHSRLFPDKKIIGWHHTHPGYGIFLSSYDLFIQQNFFNLPWQIAYVVDPVNNTRGFFQWKNEKVVKLGGFYIYDDVGKKINIPARAALEKAAQGTAKSKKIRRAFAAVVIVLAAALIASIISNVNLKNRLGAAYNELTGALYENEKLDGECKNLGQQNNALSAKLDELQQKINQEGSSSSPGTVIFQKYVVQRGDTLTSICRKLNIDYAGNIGIIKKINRLTDPNIIYEGQMLLLPL